MQSKNTKPNLSVAVQLTPEAITGFKPILCNRSGADQPGFVEIEVTARGRPLPEPISATKKAGYDKSAVARRIVMGGRTLADATHMALTVSAAAVQDGRGKIVIAEFGHGGKLLPGCQTWPIDGRQPSRFTWLRRGRVLPQTYRRAMLRGREWMAGPELAL